MYRFIEAFINFIIGVIELFLGFRFFFRLFGANAGTPFVRWLYDMTDPLLNPFHYIFPSPEIDGGFVIEFTTLVALIAYMLAGYLILEMIAAIRRIPKS